jgi:O-antigen/teichoic acid export membrane protein
MSDKNYLARVLGLSLVPRLFTSVLTLVSFPILLRAVGASQYGIIVYLQAVIGVLESLADFGVSSAAGKGIAEARASRLSVLPGEVLRWARLQTVVALIGSIPVFGFSYLYLRYGGTIKIDVTLLFVMVSATWVSICSNFVRAGLRSCLDFRSLMFIDTTESLTRSLSWIVVARAFPTAMGIAGAALATALVVSLVGAVLFFKVVQAYRRQAGSPYKPTAPSQQAAAEMSNREMLRQSVHFLGLRFSTRLTQAVPIIVIGRAVGPGVVGVIGAFSRISELLGFPFTVIGNALSVRAHEVLVRDRAAVAALWDTVLRFGVLAAVVAGGMALLANPLAQLLLPGNNGAVLQFGILATTIVTSAIAAMVAPMSDYVGALPKRVALITGISIAEVPLLYAGGKLFGANGAIAAYALALCLTGAGFVFIAKRAFFGADSYRPSAEVKRFVGIVVVSLAFSATIGLVTATTGLSPIKLAAIQGASFVFGVGFGVLGTPSIRQSLVGGSFFDFTHQS